MRLLLDTHIALWAVYKPERLSEKARQLLTGENVEVFVSAASIWEIAIKNNRYPGQLPTVAEACADFTAAGFQDLPIHKQVMPVLESLPNLHSDPFDRLLIATAFFEPMHLLTQDIKIAEYDATGNVVILC